MDIKVQIEKDTKVQKANTNRNWNPKAFKPIKYQLCLQTQAMADAFYNDGKNVEKVIFFYDTN